MVKNEDVMEVTVMQDEEGSLNWKVGILVNL